MLSGTGQIEDAIRGKRVHNAVTTWNRSSLTVGVPITGAPGVDALFVKLSSWTLFFDRSGWCKVVLTSDRMRSPRKRSSVPNLLTLLQQGDASIAGSLKARSPTVTLFLPFL